MDLAAEVLQLRWPPRILAKILCAMPAHFSSDFAVTVRALGRVLRKFSTQQHGAELYRDFTDAAANAPVANYWLKKVLRQASLGAWRLDPAPTHR